MLPKYFVVKNDNSPEWEKYIKWLNEKYKINWGGFLQYYGYDGNAIRANGTDGWDDLIYFKNNPHVFNSAKEFFEVLNEKEEFVLPDTWCIQITEENREIIRKWYNNNRRGYSIGAFYGMRDGVKSTYGVRGLPENSFVITFDQFKKYVLKENQEQTKMKTQSIKREHLKEIYDVACTEWKTKLANKAKEEPFNDLIFSEEEIKEMFKAAKTDQKPILEKYFTLEEDKNAFVKKFGVYDIKEMSRKLFDNKFAFQILEACTPKNRTD